MRLYTVHVPPRGAAADAVLVKEGFCWPALFFGPFWAVWRGMWAWAAGWIAVVACLGLVEAAWPGGADVLGVIELAGMALFAAEANELRRRRLARLGLREAGVVGGPDPDTAARRFIDLAAIGAH